jgi:hypothetical protein
MNLANWHFLTSSASTLKAAVGIFADTFCGHLADIGEAPTNARDLHVQEQNSAESRQVLNAMVGLLRSIMDAKPPYWCDRTAEDGVKLYNWTGYECARSLLSMEEAGAIDDDDDGRELFMEVFEDPDGKFFEHCMSKAAEG